VTHTPKKELGPLSDFGLDRRIAEFGGHGAPLYIDPCVPTERSAPAGLLGVPRRVSKASWMSTEAQGDGRRRYGGSLSDAGSA
jgi:hypothetical protein